MRQLAWVAAIAVSVVVAAACGSDDSSRAAGRVVEGQLQPDDTGELLVNVEEPIPGLRDDAGPVWFRVTSETEVVGGSEIAVGARLRISIDESAGTEDSDPPGVTAARVEVVAPPD